MNLAFSITNNYIMSAGSIKKSESSTSAYSSRRSAIILEPEIFVEFNGVKKRRIFYNVDFTEDEEVWIRTVRDALKK